MRPHRYMSVAERFEAQVMPVTETGCWLWIGTWVKGYGQFQVSPGVRMLAHRYAMEISMGRPILDGHLACHTCDTPACCNPSHLYEGTTQSNSDDKVRRGRQATGDNAKARRRGVDHHSRKLTPESVLSIRASKSSSSQISKQYGVALQSIKKVRERRTWKHIN